MYLRLKCTCGHLLIDVWITNWLDKGFLARRMDKGTEGQKLEKAVLLMCSLNTLPQHLGDSQFLAGLCCVISKLCVVDLYSYPPLLLLLRNVPAACSSDQLCPEPGLASSAPICVHCCSEIQEKQNTLVEERVCPTAPSFRSRSH